MDLYKTKLILILLAFGLTISCFAGVGLLYFFPDFNWNWFIGLALFYLLIESLVVLLVEKYRSKENKSQSINIFMATKVLKVIASLIFVSIYVFAVKENIKAFVSVFILLYLLYLIAETFIFMKIEKRIKEKKQ